MFQSLFIHSMDTYLISKKKFMKIVFCNLYKESQSSIMLLLYSILVVQILASLYAGPKELTNLDRNRTCTTSLQPNTVN